MSGRHLRQHVEALHLQTLQCLGCHEISQPLVARERNSLQHQISMSYVYATKAQKGSSKLVVRMADPLQKVNG